MLIKNAGVSLVIAILHLFSLAAYTLIARFMWPTWARLGPTWPRWAPWTLLSGYFWHILWHLVTVMIGVAFARILAAKYFHKGPFDGQISFLLTIQIHSLISPSVVGCLVDIFEKWSALSRGLNVHGCVCRDGIISNRHTLNNQP